MAIPQNNIIMCCLFLMLSLFHDSEEEEVAQRIDWNVPFSVDHRDDLIALDNIAYRDDDDEDEDDKLDLELPLQKQGELDFLHFPAVNNDSIDFDVPPGYKFSPNDQDLILHYLGNYMMGLSLPHSSTIRHIELHNYDPNELPIGKSKRFLKNQLFFFTSNEAAYSEEAPRIAARTGYWRCNGSDEKICVEDLLVGFKRTYMFYRGKGHEAEKTPWSMLEYRINPEIIPEAVRTNMESTVVCKIIYRVYIDLKKKKN